MTRTCEHEGAVIVILGKFNPAIFQPFWLSTNELIPKKEAESAKVEAVSRDVSAFATDWLQLQVTSERFVASTPNPAYHGPLRDLTVGIFTILEHTPVTAMGLNGLYHYKLGSKEQCHELGHLVAPKAPWNGIITEPGLLSLSMNGVREGSDGRFTVKIEPSRKVQPLGTGVFFETNEHFASLEQAWEDPMRELLDRLKRHWNDSQLFAKRAIEGLLAQVPE